MLTIFEELVSVAICSRSNLRSTGLKGVSMPKVKEPIGVLCLIATSKRKVSSQISFAFICVTFVLPWEIAFRV